jgi:hypothetical protein
MRSRPRSRTRLLVATLLALALAVGAGQGFAGTLVERTVAFVNKKPVLLSDVELTKALLKLEEKEAIESAIDERLMFEDASRLASDTPPEELVVRAVQVLREKAGERFTSAALRRKAVIQVAISSYIDQRLRPQVRVEDTEVRKAFNDKILNDPQPPAFSLVADALRKSLEQRSLDQKIEEWVASLRRREEVRRVPTRP